MILVTVGNATQSFSRLLRAVETLVGARELEAEIVIIQAGNDRSFRASHCEQYDFLSPEAFADLITAAEVVICHGGAGTLHHVFQVGKTPVVMPRRKKYGEHLDDQLELVKALAAENRIIPAYEPEDLPAAIREARRRNSQPRATEPLRAIGLVSDAITELIGG
jgi:UDP-N-acetylglucosamine transferase subunit ALG13